MCLSLSIFRIRINLSEFVFIFFIHNNRFFFFRVSWAPTTPPDIKSYKRLNSTKKKKKTLFKNLKRTQHPEHFRRKNVFVLGGGAVRTRNYYDVQTRLRVTRNGKNRHGDDDE